MPYTPKPPPRTKPEFQDLYDYIEQELQSISRELLETVQLELRTANSEPIRPREGMIAQADGTNWDPGEGAGTYKYEAGNWVKFGDASHVHTLVDITDAGALAALDQADVANIGPIASSRIVARKTAGSGDAEEATLSEVLDFIGSAARGDLLVRGASTWARLAKGAANEVLKSDGTDLVWGSPPGWTSLQTNTPSASSTSDFSSISQNYKALLFLGTQLDGSANINLNVRSATSSGFSSWHTTYRGSIGVTGSSVGGTGLTDETTGPPFLTSIDSVSTGYFALLILNYTSSKHKMAFAFGGNIAQQYSNFNMLVFATTSALQNIRFVTGSGTFSGTIEMIGLF